jgi:hypothetical protein
METKEIESFLNRINSVITSRIIHEGDDIKEIHIVSDLTRNPKQVTRDVESILVSQFNLPIDYKMISVAQVDGCVSGFKDFRFRLVGVQNSFSGSICNSIVSLERDGEVFEGTASGISTASNILRINCLATINAVECCCGITNVFALDDVMKFHLANKEVLLAVLTAIIGSTEVMVSGSAINGKSQSDLAVKATLDAVNRIVSKAVL